MRRILLLFAITLSVSTGGLSAQKVTNDAPEILENIYSRLIKSHSDSVRIQMNDSIKLLIERYISSDTVFQSNFKNLRYLGQIT